MQRTAIKRRPYVPRPLPKGTLQFLIERDGARCSYRYGDPCGGEWTSDHVIPRSLAVKHESRIGFSANHIDNLVVACRDHNVAKYTRRLIPRAWADKLEWLNDLGIGTFRVWDGDAQSLRVTVR